MNSKNPYRRKSKLLENQAVDASGCLRVLEGLDRAFLEVLRNHTAGSPVNETVKWTNLKRGEIAARFAEQGCRVSMIVVVQLLEKHDFRARQAFKTEAGKKTITHRDEQFKNIDCLKEDYHARGNPVMSMDVKKICTTVLQYLRQKIDY